MGAKRRYKGSGVSHIGGLSCDQWGAVLIVEKGVEADCRKRISKGCKKGM